MNSKNVFLQIRLSATAGLSLNPLVFKTVKGLGLAQQGALSSALTKINLRLSA